LPLAEVIAVSRAIIQRLRRAPVYARPGAKTTFDGWGRTLTTTDPDGVVATSVYDASNLTDLVTTRDNVSAATTMTYDLVGNLLSTSTPTGRVTSSTYDLANHVLTSTAPDGTVSRTDYNAWGERAASWANYTTGTTGGNTIYP
jgi:YD repeat-containing protein